jgi:hypothetical protein
MKRINARLLARASHAVNALLLAVYLYTSLGDAPGFQELIRTAVFPALVVTGLVLWLLPSRRAWPGYNAAGPSQSLSIKEISQ